MQSFHDIVARGALAARAVATDAAGNPPDTVINAMIALLSLVFFGLVLVAILVLLKRMRKQQQMRAEILPQYYDSEVKSGRNANHRRLTINTGNGRRSVLVFNRDGSPMLANPSSPPHSPDNVPEIHITFPDEHDEQGRRKSGRVVVVRVGDATVGMEPLQEEQLPAYEKEGKGQFYSIDIDHIGGLKEKDPREFH